MLDRTADKSNAMSAPAALAAGTVARTRRRKLASFLPQPPRRPIDRFSRGIDAFARARAATGSFFGRAWHVLRTEGIASLPRHGWHFFVAQSFSSLTRRIVFLNLAGLLALVLGILYLTQFRAGLIDARVQSLIVQGEIIAGAIAASATVETDTDHHRSRPAAGAAGRRKLRPERRRAVGSNFRSIRSASRRCCAGSISPTHTRARIYDRDGTLLLDSRNLYGRGDILRFDLPPPTTEKPGSSSAPSSPSAPGSGAATCRSIASSGGENGKGYPEVAKALNGQKASIVRINERGEVIVLGRGADPALPRRARRAAAVDPGRRHRPDRRGRAARRSSRSS